MRTLRHIFITLGSYFFLVLPVFYTVGVMGTGIYVPHNWLVFTHPIGWGAFMVASVIILIDIYRFVKKEVL